MWLSYTGLRVDSIQINESVISVIHLEPIASTTPGSFWLPVSTKCLVEDLMCAIEMFERDGHENERVTAWNRATRDLTVPEPYDFSP